MSKTITITIDVAFGEKVEPSALYALNLAIDSWAKTFRGKNNTIIKYKIKETENIM